MKKRNLYHALFAGFAAIIVASVYSTIPSLSRWDWALLVSVSGTVAFLPVYFVNDIVQAVRNGLKRLPWVIFTAILVALGVFVGWIGIGFVFIYLLGVSTFALIGAIMIASIFKKTSFGRKLSERISRGLLYAISFMRLTNRQTEIRNFDNHIRVTQLRVSELFEWIE